MSGEQFINPNLHVIFVHYPIALIVLGTLIELFSFLGWRRSGFRSAGRWMIFLGVLSGIPTALAGIYALNDVVRMSLGESLAQAHWAEARAASALVADATAWEMAQRHAWLNAGVTAVLTIAVVTWAGGGDGFRRFLYLPVLLLLVVGVAATGAGAWYGGEMVYRRGVAVMNHPLNPSTGIASHEHAAGQHEPDESTTAPTTFPATAESEDELSHDWTYYVPPMQTHMVLAGFTVAMAMAALAVSFRRANLLIDNDRNFPPTRSTPAEINSTYGGRPPTYPLDANRPDLYPGLPRDESMDGVPAGRFWVLAFFLALGTALLGAWMFLGGIETPVADAIRTLPSIWNDQIAAFPRRMLHVISGSAIIVLPLLLALITAFAPRQRWAIFLIAIWLVAAVALQVWLGTLMLWDGSDGPWNAFHPPAP